MQFIACSLYHDKSQHKLPEIITNTENEVIHNAKVNKNYNIQKGIINTLIFISQDLIIYYQMIITVSHKELFTTFNNDSIKITLTKGIIYNYYKIYRIITTKQ